MFEMITKHREQFNRCESGIELSTKKYKLNYVSNHLLF